MNARKRYGATLYGPSDLATGLLALGTVMMPPFIALTTRQQESVDEHIEIGVTYSTGVVARRLPTVGPTHMKHSVGPNPMCDHTNNLCV